MQRTPLAWAMRTAMASITSRSVAAAVVDTNVDTACLDTGPTICRPVVGFWVRTSARTSPLRTRAGPDDLLLDCRWMGWNPRWKPCVWKPARRPSLKVLPL